MLLTTRKYINKLEHYREAPYHLYPLLPRPSIDLLLKLSPRKINNKELTDLLVYKVPKNHPKHQYLLIPTNEKLSLLNHPFIRMLGGHPQAIALAAPLLEDRTLVELFQELLESNVMDALDYQE